MAAFDSAHSDNGGFSEWGPSITVTDQFLFLTRCLQKLNYYVAESEHIHCFEDARVRPDGQETRVPCLRAN